MTGKKKKNHGMRKKSGDVTLNHKKRKPFRAGASFKKNLKGVKNPVCQKKQAGGRGGFLKKRE